LFSAVLLIVLSPTVWTDVFHLTSTPPVPLKNPALISMTLAFLTGWIVSLVTRDEAAEAKFEEQRVRSYLGADEVHISSH
jgi:cation/acetate symporter